MSQSLTHYAAPAAAAWSGAQLALIKNTVARDCNTDEFNLFVTVARNAGLDPFRKQIMALVFSKENAQKRRMAIVTGIDGLRALAARSERYRPDDEAPRYHYSADLKDPETNPLGIESAEVVLYMADAKGGEWRRVVGVAYWDEFAAVEDEWAWNDDTRKRQPTGKRTLGGNWKKMPRLMIAKCAEAQALRKAFPEETGGLYEHAELDRAQIIDVTPTEIIEGHEQEQRLAKIGSLSGAITMQLSPASPLEQVPLGQVADRVLETARQFDDVRQLDWFESANTFPLREFWARAKGEALEVKAELGKIRDRLAAKRDEEAGA